MVYMTLATANPRWFEPGRKSTKEKEIPNAVHRWAMQTMYTSAHVYSMYELVEHHKRMPPVP